MTLREFVRLIREGVVQGFGFGLGVGLAAPVSADRPEDDECLNCGGLGMLPGCFEDTCCGADCDPEDPEYCCAPAPCDWCGGGRR